MLAHINLDGACTDPPYFVYSSIHIHQGRPHTAESRAKISAANKGKTPWNKGLGHSEETKARIRERTKQVRKTYHNKYLFVGLVVAHL